MVQHMKPDAARFSLVSCQRRADMNGAGAHIWSQTPIKLVFLYLLYDYELLLGNRGRMHDNSKSIH